MQAASFEHGQDARMALRAIVGDPAHGSDALANPRILAGLLGDLLPDAPRESGLLLAAAEKDVPGALRDHVRHGMDIGTAISLTASSLAASTAFGPEVCEWVTTEFAIALGLGVAEQPPGPAQAAASPPDDAWPAISTEPPAAAYARDLATEAPGHGLGPGPGPGRGPAPGPGPGPAGLAAVPHPMYAAQPPPPLHPAQPPYAGQAPPAGTVPRPRSRRRPGIIAVLASAVVVALAVAGYALFRVSAGDSPSAGAAPPGTSTPGSSVRPGTSSPVTSPSAGTSGSAVPVGPGGAGEAPATWSGIWIAQLASVPFSEGTAALSSQLAKIRLEAPGAQVLNSSDYASLNPGIWVIYYPGGFSDGTQALRFCAARGWTSKNKCIGRYLSHDAADFNYQCYPPAGSPTASCFHQPARPPDVVRSYLTAVNLRDWPAAWQLGGKNLGQTYSQMIAGYQHTSRILVSHLSASGDAVSVRTLAYETNGAVQKYALSYDVQGGVIVSGHSTLIASG